MATTLNKALETIVDNGGARRSVKKHLEAVGIKRWSDINKAKLYEFRDHLVTTVSANTARTILARTKAMMERFSDEVNFPAGWRSILTTKGDKPVKTYLTPEELEAFAAVPTHSLREEVVKCECLLEAFVGARVSDIRNLTTENIVGGNLVYVSQKSKVRASIPVGDRVIAWLDFAQQHRDLSPKYKGTRCDIILRLAKRAGLDAPVFVRQGGVDERGPKWKYVTSHTFRVSFVTNLQQAGLDLLTISRMAGHTNVAMTERYCAITPTKLNDKAAEYLGV